MDAMGNILSFFPLKMKVVSFDGWELIFSPLKKMVGRLSLPGALNLLGFSGSVAS